MPCPLPPLSVGSHLDRLSREFEVSAAVLQVQRGQRGLRNWTGLILGHILSRETGLSVEQLAAEYQSGKGWAQIAREHGVGRSQLNRELSELRARLEVDLTAPSSR